MNMDSRLVTLLVLLDLSVAFDTVNHVVLSNRLSTSFGVRGSALHWFASNLSNRSQRVSFNQKLSEDFQLDCGVPQGSCLGLLLFMICVSELFEVIKEYLSKAHAYADDTQLHLWRLTRHPRRSMQLTPWSVVWMQLDAGWSKTNSVWTIIRRNSSQ